MEADSRLESALVNRDKFRPMRPTWMFPQGPQGTQREAEDYEVYIQMPRNHHYGSNKKLKLSLDHKFVRNIHKPTVAYIRFKANENFKANFFQLYEIRPLDNLLPVGDHGRLFISYPGTRIYTALLERDETYVRYSSPKTQPWCCLRLPGGRR